MGNDKNQEESYDPHHLSTFTYSDCNKHRSRKRYGKEELLNCRFIVSREEQLRKWNEIITVLGSVGNELGTLQMNTDSKHPRSHKNKQQNNKLETASEEGNDKRQQEKSYDPDHLSSDSNACRPRIKYSKEYLFNLQFEEEQVGRCNKIMAAIGPCGGDLRNMEKSDQMSTKRSRRRASKKIERENKTETISTGSVVLLKSAEECYEELPSSEISGLKAAALQKSSNSSFERNKDSESSDDEFDSLLKPALALEGEPDFASGSPQDGFEYLR